ncbi:MAG: hypothetical protein HYY25_16540 [Candidatus Wallbacteria bacterium]|nr:hypothetical protein [Candidatus Wallbacteria bacterium]
MALRTHTALTVGTTGDTRARRHLLAYDPSLVTEVLGAFLDLVFRHLRWKAKRVLGHGAESAGRARPLKGYSETSGSVHCPVSRRET